MKRSRAIILLSCVVFIGLAFVHPFGNPRIEPTKGFDTLLQDAQLPTPAKKILIAKCADCHSNETRWPVYARIAPGSWLIERDIIEARKKMNLSLWDQMPADTQTILLGQIIHEASTGDMPPPQYRLLHWQSKLTAADIATLSTMQSGSQFEDSPLLGDATRGRAVFDKRCTGCHAIDADREGPRLADVFGRKAASMPGFSYSAGLKKSGLTWDETTLDKWLADPDLLVPGNTMDFHVPSPQERSDLVAYFKQSRR